MNRLPAPALEPIAIVGIGCRFPGADGPAAFWRLVLDGVDAITDMPAGRFDAEALYDATPGARGKIVTRQGGFLREIDRFEPSFFGISPREAACIDPQQRLLLEVAWEAFEDAGVTAERLAGSGTGVFVGMWTSEYEGKMFGGSSDVDLYVTTGGGRYAASGRLSYAFDLRGPSLTLDTACSSSLVAVHLACLSLRSGESEMALAGGVNLILEPHITIGYSRSAMLSADGRCRFGDARASGYVRSEGVGLVLLKPLARALADRDPIHAVIRGSAVNNDGQGSGLLVAPSPTVQAAMLRQAYRAAGVEPGRVGYVEAHGTGTRAGDPVELTALGEVLGEGRVPGHPCLTGSVKTNIGHAEAASGIAGLIKAVLCLEHRTIPPSLHLSEPNPRIPWDELPLIVARTAQPWPEAFRPAFAGVNSFGVTGTNAHVVLEEAPARPPTPSPADRRAHVLPLSAKSAEALRALAERWVVRLEHDPAAADLDDRVYTASVRRTHHEHRLAVVGTTGFELAQCLRAYVKGEGPAGLVSGVTQESRARVVFVFPGMGSQLLGLGRALLATERVFREALEECERALAPHVSWSLTDELAADGDRSQLDRVDVMQPALFAVEVALAALWRAWGIEPDAVVGHSMGEVAAAHVAGALSLEDAARVIALRSRLLGMIAGQGAMAVVELSLDDARRALIGRESRLCAAASNSARSTVLSGEGGALADLLADLEGRGVFCRRLKVDVAFHSPQVDALRADLQAGLEGIAPRASDVPFYSTVTGALAGGETLGAEYWVRNLREPVLFAAALGRLAADGFGVFVETSLHPVLLAAVQEAVPPSGPGVCLPSGRRGEDERAVMLESLASLWARGYPVDWTRLFPGGGRVVPLPAYPWQRERFWFEANRPRRAMSSAGHPSLATHVTPASAAVGTELWEGEIAAADYACLASGRPTTLSASARLHAVLSAARQIATDTFTLEDVRFPDELRLGDDVATVQLVVRPAVGGRDVQLFGRPTAEAAWATIASVARLSGLSRDGAARARHDIDTIRTRSDELDVEGIDGWPQHDHRPPLVALRLGDGEALGRLHDAPAAECAIHPEALEAGLRALVTALGATDEGTAGWEPSAIRAVRAHAPLASAAWVYAVAGDSVDRRLGDVCILDATGAPLLELHGVEITRRMTGTVEDLFHRVDWQPHPRASGVSRSAGRWLIVADADAHTTELVARLQAAGDTCVVVSPVQVLGGAVGEVLASTPPVTGCVHLASVAVNPDVSPTVPDAADLGWAGALAVVHALAGRVDGTPPRFWLVTRGAQRVNPADGSVSLGAAAVWGLGAVIAYEHPALRATRVDLGLGSGEIDAPALAAELLGADTEDQVAVRGTTRYAARLVRGAPTDAVSSGAGGTAQVTADGAYLITGGTGGLGLVVARWLVSRGARHLTLMGRRAPTADVARVVEELRAAGAEVSIARGDVTRREDVRRVVADLSGGRPLRGVIHAAGFVDDGLLVNLDRERFAGVLAAKADGALYLDEATRELGLDFFVCFSSAVGVLGSPGQGNYAAANACLDGVAARRRARGQPALSIAWGPWARVGMAAARRDRGQRLAARGLASLAPEEGVEALERLLGTSAAPVLVMRLDPGRWSRAYASGARSLLRGLHDAASAAVESPGLLARLRAATPIERRALLETHLREQVGQVLRVAAARVDPATPLKSLGLNSLMSLELRNRLEAALGLTLPATLVWNYPTVTAVAAHLEERLGLATPALGAADSVHVAEPELEGLLAEIQGLSDEEVRRLLAEGRTGARDE